MLSVLNVSSFVNKLICVFEHMKFINAVINKSVEKDLPVCRGCINKNVMWLKKLHHNAILPLLASTTEDSVPAVAGALNNSRTAYQKFCLHSTPIIAICSIVRFLLY